MYVLVYVLIGRPGPKPACHLAQVRLVRGDITKLQRPGAPVGSGGRGGRWGSRGSIFFLKARRMLIASASLSNRMPLRAGSIRRMSIGALVVIDVHAKALLWIAEFVLGGVGPHKSGLNPPPFKRDILGISQGLFENPGQHFLREMRRLPNQETPAVDLLAAVLVEGNSPFFQEGGPFSGAAGGYFHDFLVAIAGMAPHSASSTCCAWG